MTYKKKYILSNNNSIRRFRDNEIFFNTYFLIKECYFSPKLNYYSLKKLLNNTFLTQLRYTCLLSNKRRSFISKLKLSRLAFSRQQKSGLLTGIYRSI